MKVKDIKEANPDFIGSYFCLFPDEFCEKLQSKHDVYFSLYKYLDFNFSMYYNSDALCRKMISVPGIKVYKDQGTSQSLRQLMFDADDCEIQDLMDTILEILSKEPPMRGTERTHMRFNPGDTFEKLVEHFV